MDNYGFPLIILLLFCFYRYRDLRHKVLATDLVKYCVSKSPLDVLYSFHYLCEGADQEFHIAKGDESSFARGIIISYQDFLSKRFFQDQLPFGYQYYNFTSNEYLLFSLYSFLRDHVCDSTFNGNDMYVEISRTNYGQWGGKLYESENTLTDYGVVYLKLYYLACYFCVNNKKVKKYIYPNDLSDIGQIIHNRSMSISSY